MAEDGLTSKIVGRKRVLVKLMEIEDAHAAFRHFPTSVVWYRRGSSNRIEFVVHFTSEMRRDEKRMTPSGTVSGLWTKRFALRRISMFTAFRGGDGTPGNPDYQSGIRGQILPTVMCRPVEPDARRRACPVRRRLIGVISLLIYNEVIPMFDPISRAPVSWEPAHEHGRRGQTLNDFRC